MEVRVSKQNQLASNKWQSSRVKYVKSGVHVHVCLEIGLPKVMALSWIKALICIMMRIGGGLCKCLIGLRLLLKIVCNCGHCGACFEVTNIKYCIRVSVNILLHKKVTNLRGRRQIGIISYELGLILDHGKEPI